MLNTDIVTKNTNTDKVSNILEYYQFEGILDQIKHITNDINIVNSTRTDSKKYEDSKTKLTSKTYENLKTFELITHTTLSELVEPLNRKGLKYLINQIETEYSCNTSIEKLLASTIAFNYFKLMELNKEFKVLTTSKHVNPYGQNVYGEEVIKMSKVISSKIDKLHKQINNSILILKNLKTTNPIIKVSVDKAIINT